MRQSDWEITLNSRHMLYGIYMKLEKCSFMSALILWDYVCCFRATLVTLWGNVRFRACRFNAELTWPTEFTMLWADLNLDYFHLFTSDHFSPKRLGLLVWYTSYNHWPSDSFFLNQDYGRRGPLIYWKNALNMKQDCSQRKLTLLNSILRMVTIPIHVFTVLLSYTTKVAVRTCSTMLLPLFRQQTRQP